MELYVITGYIQNHLIYSHLVSNRALPRYYRTGKLFAFLCIIAIDMFLECAIQPFIIHSAELVLLILPTTAVFAFMEGSEDNIHRIDH